MKSIDDIIPEEEQNEKKNIPAEVKKQSGKPVIMKNDDPGDGLHDDLADEDEKEVIEINKAKSSMWAYINNANRINDPGTGEDLKKNDNSGQRGYETYENELDISNEIFLDQSQDTSFIPRERDNNRESISISNDTEKKDYSEYKINALTRLEYKKNQDQITRLYNLLDSKDNWLRGTSDNFINLKRELRELKELSAALVRLRADHGEIKDEEESRQRIKEERAILGLYINKAEEVVSNADTYIRGKKNHINSPYARARFDTVVELEEIIKQNISSFEDAYHKEDVNRVNDVSERRRTRKLAEEFPKKRKDWYENINKKYEISSLEGLNRQTYLGKEFTQDYLLSVSCPYSVSRTAGINLANYILMCEKKEDGTPKFSIDDILDPSKLKDEKEKTFKDVVTHMIAGDHKWVNERIYDGNRAAMENIEKFIKNVDFANPDYIYSEDFTKAMVLAYAAFDMWQEEARFPEAMFEVIKEREKDLPEAKKTKSFDEYHDKNESMRGGLDLLFDSMQRNAQLVSQLDDPYMGSANKLKFMANIFSEQKIREVFEQKVKSGKGKPFSEWFVYDDRNVQKGIYAGSRAHMASLELPKDEVFYRNFGDIISGKVFGNMTYTYNPNASANETRFKIDGNVDFLSMKEDNYLTQMTDYEVTQRIDAMLTYYDELKKSSDRELQGYINKAIKGITELAKYRFAPHTMTPEDKEKPAEGVKDVFSSQVAMELKKVGASGDTLRDGVEKALNGIHEFKRFTRNIGIGKLTGILIGDLSSKIEAAPSVTETKAEIAKSKIEKGEYKNQKDMFAGFALAYAYAMYKHTGKLPYKPSMGRRRFTFNEFVDDCIEKGTVGPVDKKMLKKMMRNPDLAVQILNNKDELNIQRQYEDDKVTQALNAANGSAGAKSGKSVSGMKEKTIKSGKTSAKTK